MHTFMYQSTQIYLRFAFMNKVYQVWVLTFGLSKAPQVFTHLGHTVAGYLHHQGILALPSLDEWLVHHPDHQFLLFHHTILLQTLDLVVFKLNVHKSELEPVQDMQFLGVQLFLDLGRAVLPDSKAWEIVAHCHNLSSQSHLSFKQVSAFVATLILASDLPPVRSSAPETATTTLQF